MLMFNFASSLATMIWLLASLSTLVKIILEKMLAMLLNLLLKSLPFLTFYRLDY